MGENLREMQRGNKKKGWKIEGWQGRKKERKK
jgi:hypothetical protein